MGILILVIIGIFIYLLVSRSRDRQEFLHHFSQNTTNSSSDDDSLRILKTRYAKGEISEEEFEHMKKHLSYL